MHVLLTGSLLCRDRSRGEMIGRGQEGSERGEGVPRILSESFTKWGCHATVFMNFYRKSAGVSTGCSAILLHDVSKWDVWGWMVDGRCMDGYGGRMGVWSDLGTDGWSDEMIGGRLTWLEGSWDNNGEEGKVTWQKRRWEMREQTWWWSSWSERGSNERGGDEGDRDALHNAYSNKSMNSCKQTKS